MKAEERNRLEASVDITGAQRTAAIVAVLTVVSVILALNLPAELQASDELTSMAHLIIELAAVAMATHVISMAWSGLSHGASATANVLILCFGVVAGADLFYALTHESVQSSFLAANQAIPTWFWVGGRAFQVAAMTLMLFPVQLPGQRALWLEAAILVVIIATAVAGLPAIHQTMMVAGVEVAALLSFTCWFLAFGFFSRFKRTGELSDLLLVMSCFFAGLATYVFRLADESPVRQHVLSDMLRVASYACLHRAIFVNGFQGPLRRLVHSENALRERSSELKNILDHLPVGLCRLNRDLNVQYANGNFKSIVGATMADVSGQPFVDVVPRAHTVALTSQLQQVLEGEKLDFNYEARLVGQPIHHRHVVLAPSRQGNGAIDGVLGIFSDISARENALQQAAESAQEIFELKAALDAHAIVAVTNAKGMITRVNDKFCLISQYGRDELVGRTHKVINSGFHPKGFFGDMWKVISRGEVWNGEVCNRAKDGSLYWVHTTIVPLLGPQGVPVQYIAIRADITQRKEAEAEAQRMALHDVLTGLPNRRLMNDRLHQALATTRREKHYGALIVLDMDNFKDVNDTLGHASGDQLLRQIAIRISESVRQSDTVARLGGDEFVVILENVGSLLCDATAKALDIGSKVRDELAKPYLVGSSVINTSSSIGVVLFSQIDRDADELVKQADMALYKAKEDGRNRLAFFDPQLQAEITARSALLRELREAIPKNELRLYYQPVVNSDMHIVGVEGLIRWQQDRLGLVPPGAFIPLAEQSNLILPIGNWVLGEACKQLKQWEGDLLRKHWTLAVNVSAKQFHDDDFVSSVLVHLATTGASASKLRIEITESLMHINLAQTIVKMETLRTIGVLFSLDDFGTGYSSLSYLKQLPLDQLKIDRSFVAEVLDNQNDAAIVRAVIGLAENLGLSIVAEGVETAAQVDVLLSFGCKAFQGYLFSKPVPADHLPTVLTLIPERSRGGRTVQFVT